jgi:hypothetical protein
MPVIENPLERLPEDALKAALDASDALMQHKRFMPRGGLLVMLVSRFRDDTRGALAMEPERYPGRGGLFSSVDDLTSTELDKVSGAVATLLEERFTNVMDDPELAKQLRDFCKALDDQKTERAQIRASLAS